MQTMPLLFPWMLRPETQPKNHERFLQQNRARQRPEDRSIFPHIEHSFLAREKPIPQVDQLTTGTASCLHRARTLTRTASSPLSRTNFESWFERIPRDRAQVTDHGWVAHWTVNSKVNPTQDEKSIICCKKDHLQLFGVHVRMSCHCSVTNHLTIDERWDRVAIYRYTNRIHSVRAFWNVCSVCVESRFLWRVTGMYQQLTSQ